MEYRDCNTFSYNQSTFRVSNVKQRSDFQCCHFGSKVCVTDVGSAAGYYMQLNFCYGNA
jgi:hypothetical protein